MKKPIDPDNDHRTQYDKTNQSTEMGQFSLHEDNNPYNSNENQKCALTSFTNMFFTEDTDPEQKFEKIKPARESETAKNSIHKTH